MKTHIFGNTPLRVLVAACLVQTGLHAGIVTGSKDIGAVWFIGDSITQSNADDDSNGSPRKSLYDLLVANGYTFSYTGHSTSNTDGLPTTGGTAPTNLYHYHTGISGSVIGDNTIGRTNITAGISTYWINGRLASVKPNVILIMLGTNDVDQNVDLPNAPARLTNLVNTIYQQLGPNDPNPTVMIATIPPNRTTVPADINNTATFNAAVPGVVSAQRSLGRDVHLVDQFTPLNDSYSTLMRSDNLHTNAAGNNSLAQQWYAKIAELVATPVPTTLIVTGSNAARDTDGSPAAGYATAATFSLEILSTDLIDASQPTLASAVMDKVASAAIQPGVSAMNNGVGHPMQSSTGTYLPVTFGNNGKMPFTYDVTLNTSVNTLGYTITEIRSFAGWNQNGSKFANQKYELFVSRVGSAAFTSLGTFTYAPFENSDTNDAAATKMVLTDESGIIADEVDALRFVFVDPGFNNGSTGVDGSVFHEIDVIGSALPLPPPPDITVIGSVAAAETDNAAASGYVIAATYTPEILANDLINAGQPTLVSATWDKAPFFQTGPVNDGTGHPTNTGTGTFLPVTLGSGGKMPFTYTAVLSTATHPFGYEINEIRSFAGWNQNGATLANQKYELQVRKIGSSAFVSLGTFQYTPFNAESTGTEEAAATKMVLSPTSGVIATGVDAVRFILMDHGFKRGIEGTVLSEIDVIGKPADGFNVWADRYQISADASNDDDEDGLNDLMEYALGLDPTKASNLPALQPVSGGVQIGWTKGALAAADSRISYQAWISENLTIWNPAPTENVTNSTGSLILKLPTGSPKMFGRLKVTRREP